MNNILIMILIPRVSNHKLRASLEEHLIFFLITQLIGMCTLNVKHHMAFMQLFSPLIFAATNQLLQRYDLSSFFEVVPNLLIEECRVEKALTVICFLIIQYPIRNNCQLLFTFFIKTIVKV